MSSAASQQHAVIHQRGPHTQGPTVNGGAPQNAIFQSQERESHVQIQWLVPLGRRGTEGRLVRPGALQSRGLGDRGLAPTPGLHEGPRPGQRESADEPTPAAPGAPHVCVPPAHVQLSSASLPARPRRARFRGVFPCSLVSSKPKAVSMSPKTPSGFEWGRGENGRATQQSRSDRGEIPGAVCGVRPPSAQGRLTPREPAPLWGPARPRAGQKCKSPCPLRFQYLNCQTYTLRPLNGS